MTDREETLTPPADKKTDPPTAADTEPPVALRLSEQVALRLDGIEIGVQTAARRLDAAVGRLDKLDELHALLTGVAVDPDTGRGVTVLDELREIKAALVVIKGNSEIVIDRHREYADEVARVYQDNVQLRRDVRDHERRLGLIESTIPPAV